MTNGINDIAQAVEQVRSRIEAAAQRSGRGAQQITLVAVTKTVDPALMALARDAGITDFGENLAQEIVRKFDQFIEQRWHMIGHLQSNKVKYIIGRCALVQSVDRLAVAQELERRAERAGIVQPVLLQVNIGAEPQKSGVAVDGLWPLCDQVMAMEHLALRGLMTVPPASPDPEQSRGYFARMARLADEMENRYGAQARQWLSMGMSTDFEVAIEEGANMVRVGTGIFGARRPAVQKEE